MEVILMLKNRITIRLTDKEKENFTLNCYQKDITPSVMIRKWIKNFNKHYTKKNMILIDLRDIMKLYNFNQETYAISLIKYNDLKAKYNITDRDVLDILISNPLLFNENNYYSFKSFVSDKVNKTHDIHQGVSIHE